MDKFITSTLMAIAMSTSIINVDTVPKLIKLNIEKASSEINVCEESTAENETPQIEIAVEETDTRKRDLSQFEGKKLLAFTFDDGPNTATTEKLLDNLDKYNARVTFFVVGSRVNTYKDTLLKAYEQGNQIGSHTYSHSNLLKTNLSNVQNEIDKTNGLIENVTGEKPKVIRPPYGNTNANIRNLSDMTTINWDVDTLDWKYRNAERVKNHIISHAHDGAIILLHDIYSTSVEGALSAMEVLQNEGYAFVTIDEMAEIKQKEMNNTHIYYNMK